MFDVFIKNYKNSSGVLVTTEEMMFTIPTVFSGDSGYPVTKASSASSEDSADSFEFTMEQGSPYYNALLQLKTLIRVVYDGDVIFNGRVLTVNEQTVYRTKLVHCEGVYGYMNDSWYAGVKEKNKNKISWSTYLNRIINNHNTYLTENAEKQITRGNVTIDGSATFTPTDEQRKYEPDSWTQTSSLINNLKSEFGGHFRVRTTGGLTAGASCTNYLDWYKYYARDLGNNNRPVVEVCVNIVDLNSDTNVDNIFTRVIALGKTNGSGDPISLDKYVFTDKDGTQHTHSGKYMKVKSMRTLYTDAQLTDEFHSASDYQNAETNFGVIYKVQNFEAADTQEKLWNYTKKWIKECYYGLATQFTIRAIDMHILNTDNPKILIGDCVDIKYKSFDGVNVTTQTKRYICKAVTYDLFNPENNSYTFGIPSEILNRTYSEGKKGGNKDETTGGGGGGGGGDQEDFSPNFYNVAETIRSANVASPYGGNAAADNFLQNGEYSGSVTLYDHTVVEGDPSSEENKKYWFNASIVGKITLSGTVWIAVSSEYGMCAFVSRTAWASAALPTSYWYYRGKVKYAPFSPIVAEHPSVDQWGDVIVKISGEHGIKITHEEGTNIAKKVNDFVVDLPNKTVKLVKTIEEGAQTVINPIMKFLFGDDGEGGKVEVSDGDGNTTVEVAGDNGAVKLSDEDGNTNVELSGEDATVDVNDPTTGRPSVSIDGTNKFIKMEKDRQGNWKLQLNVPITYTDAQGNTQTTNNAITAADFQVPDVPSFKTKLAVIDQLVAGEATIGELTAAFARIKALEADAITTQKIESRTTKAHSIIATQWFSTPGSVSASNFFLNGGGESSLSLRSAIRGVKIIPTSNTGEYQLQYQIFGNDNWQDAGDPFEMAGGIEDVSWSWANGSARIDISLQGGDSERYNSPAIDHMRVLGDLSWIGTNKKKFNADFAIYDENSHLVIEFDDFGPIDVTESWNAGHSAGYREASPTATGISLGGRQSGPSDPIYNVTILRNDGNNITKQVNMRSVYDDARVGYTYGTFTPVTVTPVTGSAVRLKTSASVLYRSGSSFTVQGAQHKVTPIKSASALRISSANVQLYERGSQFTVQGSSVTVSPIKSTSVIRLGSPITTGFTEGKKYYPVVTTGGTFYYQKNSDVTYYNAGTTKKYAVGTAYSARKVLDSGGAVYYPADTQLTLYDAGTTTKTAVGEVCTAREVLDSGGALYYQAGSATQYYTKS